VMWFTGGLIMKLFNVSDHVMEIGITGIRWICFFFSFMGMEQCIGGALRGAGAVMMPLINSFIAQGCRMLATFLLAVVPLNRAIQAAVDAGQYASFELAKAADVGREGYIGMFYSMTVGMTLGAVLNFIYFRFGKWQNKGIANKRGIPGANPAAPQDMQDDVPHGKPENRPGGRQIEKEPAFEGSE